MKHGYLLLFSVLALSCDSGVGGEYNPAAIKDSITHHMEGQQKAWNEGNLTRFMVHYWANDSLRFVGKNGLNMGWQRTLDNYKRSYPDADAMGRLKFTNRVIEPLDASNAYVIGKWELFRTSDTLAGHYSLLWKFLDGKWVIVADHSS